MFSFPFLSLLLNLSSQARVLTENDGWPRVFEEAIIARWARDKPLSTPYLPSVTPTNTPQSTSEQVVELVAQNLHQLGRMYQSKQYSNIISNVQLAALYLNIMALVIHSFLVVFP